MATYSLAPVPKQIFLHNGAIVVGGLLWTYESGTDTLATTYTTADGVAHTNPIVLNAQGLAPSEIYLPPGTTQKWVFETAATPPAHGSVIWTAPTVASVPLSASNQDVLGTFGESVAAGAVVYLSDGSGGGTAGRWYLADSDNSYSSSLPMVGMSIASVTSGDVGTVRLGGQLDVVGPLTAGANYYVSATAGALTTTAPSVNARFVGQADATTSIIIAADPPPSTITRQALGICEGRLTLTTGVPVTSTDVTAATAVYFTPYKGNRIELYDGTNWNTRSFTEITTSIVGFTASRPYDFFAFDNSATVTIETVVWTNATTRATALAFQDGVVVKSGQVTRRYLGTVYINSSGGQTDDAAAFRYVFNYYNRAWRSLSKIDTANSWSSTGVAAYGPANASTANAVDVMVGVAEDTVDLQILTAALAPSSGQTYGVAVGEDSTTAPASGQLMMQAVSTAAARYYALARLVKAPAVGKHTYTWLENDIGSTPWTVYGDNNTPTLLQSGINGSWWA